MPTRFLLFIATLLAILNGCQNKKVDTISYLQAIKNGQLIFADGTTQAIPHWDEPAWIHLFCVRHAEKAKDDPKDPLLTAEGAARAERLGRIMAESGLDSVYATPYRRNQLTAEPTQRRANTPPMVSYEPDTQAEWILELLENSAGKKLLIVGHQNTVPQLLNQLKGEGFDYENIADQDYGRFYVVATKGIGETEIIETRY
jgi:phosphohistidine phosphatase SixA